jgi:DNA-directed RNA polymerase specialized sigma24 family protein
MDSIERVKEELKVIRKTNKMTIAFANAEDVLQKKANILGAAAVEKDLDTLRKTKEELQACIKLTADLENRYMKAFEELSPTNRYIMLARVINAESYAYIGYRIGYTEDTIRMRIYNIYRKLAKILY